jgi:uncharacterized membrane protein (UPF0182 family)
LRVPPQPIIQFHPRRRTIVIAAIAIALIVLLIVGQAAAGFLSNFLWFHSSGVGDIWSTATETKVLLSLVFIAIAGVLVFVCLEIVEKVTERTFSLAPDTELVRRYRSITASHALAVKLFVSVLAGLALGAGTSSQWQHWLLLTHSVAFGKTDPVFHRDISFFVFQLPFLSFLVDWMLGALIVAFVITTIAYVLSGGIRTQDSFSIEPRAIAHLSLLLSLMALERAWAYYFVDRFDLELSSNGVVRGAGYTDVHVRLPALELLAVVSLAAFIALAFNIYRRTWTLPAIAVGLWALLAIVIGLIFPALFQALKVTPAQSSLEAPYISRNIAATRSALGIGKIAVHSFPVNQDLSSSVLSQYSLLLDDVQLWDPTFSYATFQQLQYEYSYYSISSLAVDRYEINGHLQPVVIGVRQLSTTGVPSASWVNTHLEYTHGYGAVVAQSNGNGSAAVGGEPPFLVEDVPLTSTVPSLDITQPDVYFAPGNTQYVIVHTKQPEVEYQGSTGIQTTSYKGTGGIQLNNIVTRVALAVHLHDFNLLISNLITTKSRLILIPNVQTEVQTAFPFLTIDSHPYPVIDHGQIDWIFDGYTETNSYPYGQTANTGALPATSALTSNSFNYIRDAVKIVVSAYTGKMSVYALTKSDPILNAWEKVFPGIVQPISKLDPTLQAHLRYPQDLFAVQSQMYGTYHVTSAATFYAGQNAWNLSPISTGSGGSSSASLPQGPNGQAQRYMPIYEMMQLAGDSQPEFRSVEPLVRNSKGTIQPMTSIVVANSAFSSYGELSAYDTPQTATVLSPGLVNATINANQVVSKQLSLLDQGGSSVTLGTVQILPIADSLLYVRPLYVSSSQTNYPLLQDVLVLYGKEVEIEPTLTGALDALFGGAPSSTSTPTGPTTTGSISGRVRSDIANASSEYAAAQTALTAGNLGTYQSDVDQAGQDLDAANKLLTGSSSTTTSKKS